MTSIYRKGDDKHGKKNRDKIERPFPERRPEERKLVERNGKGQCECNLLGLHGKKYAYDGRAVEQISVFEDKGRKTGAAGPAFLIDSVF
jgi:hypothetical protein